jgi:tRNA-dihydrouridine synthase B
MIKNDRTRFFLDGIFSYIHPRDDRSMDLPLDVHSFLGDDVAMSNAILCQQTPRSTRLTRPLRIGPLEIDPPVLQAPMAGFTNFAFRQIVRQFGGAGLLATEMVSAKSFVWLDEQCAEDPDRLWGVHDEPRPLAVQIWDNDPAVLARVGARLAHEYRVSVVDINFGCPVRRVTERAHSGSYLLNYPDRIGAIVERVVQACAPTPVTAKIRLGCAPENITAREVARVIEQAGAAALTVHGRTAKDFFRGRADWERIADLKSVLRRIPLIGNGDLDSAETVLATLARYDVDGVMIARAALGRPWIFRQVRAALDGLPVPAEPTLDEQRQMLLDHFQRVVDRFGEEKATILMRKYACCYAQGRYGARAFRSQVSRVRNPDEFYRIVQQTFPRDPP